MSSPRSDAGEFGIRLEAEPSVDFPAISERRRKVIGTLTGGVAGLLAKNGVEVLHGEASLAPEARVTLGARNLEARKARVLATGSVKRPVPGIAYGGRVIGTEEAWALSDLPKSMAVVGAGASGSEIASAYARLGVSVMLFEGLERVLPSEDADVSKVAARAFKKQGIDVHTRTFVEDVENTDDKVTFRFGDRAAEVDWLVLATGRAPDIEALGLETAGVALTDHGFVAVDGALRTSSPKVYAIGDLTPRR
jgi:dihydrolipoamide dehydrogenase